MQLSRFQLLHCVVTRLQFKHISHASWRAGAWITSRAGARRVSSEAET